MPSALRPFDPSAARWSLRMHRGVLQVGYGERDHAPQCAALHLASGYLRLCPDERCGWGTSAVVVPSWWSRGRYRQGGRVQVRAEERGERLRLDLVAAWGCELTLTVSPPSDACIRVDVRGRLGRAPRLDARPGEAFKPVVLASMRVRDDLWDTSDAMVGERRIELPAAGWAPSPVAGVSRFGLLGGASAWKPCAPTVEVVLAEALAVAGWVTPSDDPNDDNVTLWAASEGALAEWRYKVIASAPATASVWPTARRANRT